MKEQSFPNRVVKTVVKPLLCELPFVPNASSSRFPRDFSRHYRYPPPSPPRNPRDNLLANCANKGRQCGPRDGAQRCSTLMSWPARSLGQCTDIGQVLTWNERIMAMSGIWCPVSRIGIVWRLCRHMHAPRYWVYIIYTRSSGACIVKIKRYIDMRIRTATVRLEF